MNQKDNKQLMEEGVLSTLAASFRSITPVLAFLSGASGVDGVINV